MLRLNKISQNFNYSTPAISKICSRWIPVKRSNCSSGVFRIFLISLTVGTPVTQHPLATMKKKFRGKLVSLLRERYQQGELHRISNNKEVKTKLDSFMAKQWSLYIKPYLKKPETIVRYLSRYTTRIAISNQRILAVDEQGVTFRWKDYADHDQQKTMHLDGVEFLHRFLLHVLPKGYKRIRHYGFLANCVRKSKVALLRPLLAVKGRMKRVKDKSTEAHSVLSRFYCPKCKKTSHAYTANHYTIEISTTSITPSNELI